MIHRIATNLLLRPEDVPASRDDCEVIGTFNPGAVRYGDEVVLLVRVAERPRERRVGWTALPRWSSDEELAIDWVRNDELEPLDPRVVRLKADGRVRLTFLSHLRVAVSRNGRTIERLGAAFRPDAMSEEFGVEDPRITPLDGRFYITYVAVSRYGPATALASTLDFKTFTRHGIIFCPENKDVVLFPARVQDKYVVLHRPVGGTPFSPPQMWIAWSDDLVHWGHHQHLFSGQGAWETGRVGAGTPPVDLPQGWLEIYHGNSRPSAAGQVGAYYGAAMLLAKDEPGRVLAVGREPILRPELDFEQEGFVANVVFPTGVVVEGENLLIYYGASDKYTAVVEMRLDEIMQALP
jgi:predicted GH43/DUF377 family glycosyl hydrolase